MALVALYKKVTCERMIEFPTLPATTVTHAEVGARQYCCDNDNATMRIHDNVIEPQRPEKILNIIRSQCLGGVSTTNMVMLQ